MTPGATIVCARGLQFRRSTGGSGNNWPVPADGRWQRCCVSAQVGEVTMRPTRFLAAAAIAVLVAAPPSFAAQRARGRNPGSAPSGRAVPRGSVRPAPVYPGRATPYRSYRTYRPGVRVYGYPYYYGYPRTSFYFGFGYPYTYGYPYYGSYYRGYYAPYYAPYPYPGYVGVAPGHAYGGVRIDVEERDAEVWVDGYYVGIVDDFDGTFQQVNLEPGAHRVELRLDGFEPASFDVNVEPGRTITYRTQLRPLTP
jgi:hypothetical protein